MIVKTLGRVDYLPTLEAMRAFTAARSADTPDELWLCEHPPTFTQGLAGKPEHLLLPGDQGFALLRLPSGGLRRVPAECMASIGAVSNPDAANVKIGKAGRNRWKGWRPSVRGTAMNPIDHPHGGGEGRTKGGRHPVTPWGQPTKGYKTRHNKSTDKYIVRRRSK